MELSLPLILAEVGGKRDLIGVTIVSGFCEVNGVPVVASSEVVAQFKGIILINGLPEVGGIVVAYRRRHFLEVDLTDLHVCAAGRAAEVEEQTDGRGISTLLQDESLTLEDIRTGGNIVTLLEEVVAVARVSEFEGYLRTILIYLHEHVEVVIFRSTGREFGVDVELSLPLVLAEIGGQCEFPYITIVRSLSVVDGVPVVASSEVVSCSIESRAIVNSFPHVGRRIIFPVELVVAAFFAAITLFIGLASAIVIGMILQHHVGNLYYGTSLTAAEVEHEMELSNILTFHIALSKQILRVTLERNHFVEIEVRIISGIRQFHGSTVQILISLQLDGEVVVLAGLSGNSTEVLQLELCLPTLVRLVGQIHHKLLVTLIGIGDVLSVITFPAVAVGIVAGNLPCGITQHIAVAVELISLEGLGCIVFLAGEHEAPGNAIALVEQYHLGVCQLRDSEHRVIILVIAREVGKESLGSKLQHDLIAVDIKIIGRNLRIHRCHEVDLATIILH